MRIAAAAFAFSILFAAACGDDAASPGGGGADGGRDGSPDASTPPPSESVTVTNATVDVDGTSRSYVLAVPKNYDGGKTYPLVLVFHGDGGDGSSIRAGYTFDTYSGSEAIVAYPTGRNGWDIDSPTASNADIRFVVALVADLSRTYAIDAARIFGSGYSSGAFFVNKVACRKTGFFRGIVTYAGGAPYETRDPGASEWDNGFVKCAGQTGGVAAMIVHGEADQTVTLDSGDFDATYWASINGCSEARKATTPSPCVAYDGCPSAKPVVYCAIPGLGHVVWNEGASAGWAFMKRL